MDTRSPIEIADEWLDKWSGPGTPAIGDGVSDCALDWDLPRDQPALCLASIVEVLGRLQKSDPNRLLAVLAAGPLEELLTHNGVAVIDQVDLLARRDPPFRRLLNGVWFNGISPGVHAKLSKYLGQAW